ncbi:Uncharacterized protein LW94_1882 [Fusarium fujikuroi]|nr:Uncharacterized protein LW94_1882 [Fusarium fujikuroi]
MVFHCGVWGYRYKEVYYLFDKECDEEELPRLIADKIPQDSPTYDNWLKQKRKECEKLEQLRKDALLVSLEPLECAVSPENLENHAFPGFERLYSMPSHTSPRLGFEVLISVFIDLDHQTLVVEKLGGSWSFPLRPLPRELGNLQSKLRSEEPPIGDEDEGTVASWGGLVSRMLEVLRIVSQVYNLVIAQACNASCEKDFLFRQVGYMVLSIASCDRKSVNFVDAEQLKLPYTAVDSMDKLTRMAYGILEGDGSQQPRELVPTLLSGYHDGRKPPGSAPSTTSYWMGSVFVYLTATKLSKLTGSNVDKIVKEAVAKGRKVKPEFRMIVFSIWEFILVEVTPKTVAPSQCYTLWTSRLASPVDGNGEQEFRMFSFKPHRNFAKLACFFLHKDRSGDLTGFGISRKLRVVSQDNGALSSLPLPDKEGLLSEWNLEGGQSDSRNHGLRTSKRRKTDTVQHIPIILPINKERPPSMLSVLVPWEVCRGSPPAEENEKKRAKTQLWNKHYCGRLREMLKNELKSKKSKESRIRESLQTFLVKYDRYGVTLHAKAVAMLHAHLLYIPYGIGGSKDNQSYVENVDTTYPYHILEISIGAHLIVASRHELVYFIAHFQPASEDTAEGWERAELEARRQAKKEYLRNAYLCWTKNEKTDEQRIAILVVIGTKFKVLCVDKQPKLPARTEKPPESEVNESWYYDPWKSCSNMQTDLCRAWTELTFGYVNGREQPYDLKDAKDEGAIITAMEWLVEQAESCDPTGWEGIARQGANFPYRIEAAG